MLKRWLIKKPNPQLQVKLSNALNIHPVVAQLLINRNVTDAEEAQSFLNCTLSRLHDPFLLKDMDRAVERLRRAKQRGELVLIYGDYDLDGVTASALLRRLCGRLQIPAVNYIPHRLDEGYGLNENVVEYAQAQGVGLVVTVDCGINAFAPIDALQKNGIDVIVVDHHHPDENRLPAAFAVINPKRPDCSYPFKHLSAVGLVAKLVQAALGHLPEDELDLVALGTIADVVPLVGENRIFVKQGLPHLEQTKKHGLMALLETAKIKGKKMKPSFVGFILGPRINAAGRMDSAAASLELLLSEDNTAALILAQHLEARNQERQRLQSAMVEEAIALIEREINFKDHQIIVVHKEGWHKGVLGIVASRIVEKYYRPTVVISVDNGFATGSARSIEGFHLFEALTHCSPLFENFGGHKRAAGLRLRGEHIEQFRDTINAFARQVLTPEHLLPTLSLDGELDLAHVNMDLVQAMDQLEPYGEENPPPLFCSRGLKVKSPPVVLGKGTLKFWVTDGVNTVSAVGFGMAEYQDMVQLGQEVDLAYSLTIDDWNKKPTAQLRLKDIRLSDHLK